MSKKNYQALPGKQSKTAKALIKNADVSLKYSTEICNQMRGKMVQKNIEWLEKIILHETHLPLQMYNKKVGHRRGQAMLGVKAGRYPEKVAKKIITLLELAKANADFKGLDTEKLLVIHAFASQGLKRYGHQNKGKIGGKVHLKPSINIELVVMEVKS
ncbi:MAG: 50S ribosomal protein L22 [archaeon]|jgi:large subunit ribosomal protein L22